MKQRRDDGSCWTCAKPRCLGWVSHILGRLRWAFITSWNAKPTSSGARFRLLWHDFVLHGLLNRGRERCQDCGRAYEWWHINNDVWMIVMKTESGLFCRPCFTLRQRAAGI